MKVLLFGAGYVGCVSAACLAQRGHHVTVIDVIGQKVDALNAGRSPVAEPGLGALVEQAVGTGTLHAELDGRPHVEGADIAMVCVATPSRIGGTIDTSAMRSVLTTLRDGARQRNRPLPVAIRSTITGPRLRKVCAELSIVEDCHVRIVANPEFLREAKGIEDFLNPPFVVAGGDDADAVDSVLSLYRDIDAPQHAVGLETASLVKYASNAYHAVKVSFANEIATLAELVGADPLHVMRLVASDNVLNVSAAYLKPGFSFGGSCLPKDLRAIVALAREHHEPIPMLSAVLESNARRMDQALELVRASKYRKLALCGLSFKTGTDDLRESPYVELAERLLGKGYELKIFDPDIEPTRFVGTNRTWVDGHLPHLARLLVPSFKQAIDGAEAVLLCKPVADMSQIPESLAILDVEFIAAATGRDGLRLVKGAR